jgi:hypothetical protein
MCSKRFFAICAAGCCGRHKRQTALAGCDNKVMLLVGTMGPVPQREDLPVLRRVVDDAVRLQLAALTETAVADLMARRAPGPTFAPAGRAAKSGPKPKPGATASERYGLRVSCCLGSAADADWATTGRDRFVHGLTFEYRRK